MSEKAKLQARIEELENLAKKEKYDRASAEANLNALKNQVQTIRSSISVFFNKVSYCPDTSPL